MPPSPRADNASSSVQTSPIHPAHGRSIDRRPDIAAVSVSVTVRPVSEGVASITVTGTGGTLQFTVSIPDIKAERSVLEALYRATDGDSWGLQRHEMPPILDRTCNEYAPFRIIARQYGRCPASPATTVRPQAAGASAESPPAGGAHVPQGMMGRARPELELRRQGGRADDVRGD